MKSLLSAAISLFSLFLFFASKISVLASLQGLPSLGLEESFAVESENDFLVSPKGTFSSGFYKVGTNAYCFSIWFTHSANRTVTWMANRDQPVTGQGSRLNLQRGGNLVLFDGDGTIVWDTNTFTQKPVRAQLLETGNLVLINETGETVWQSFSFPTDTLLPHQFLTKDNKLVSMKGPDTYLSGYYSFRFSDNNILSLIYSGPEIASIYWPNPDTPAFQLGRTPYNSNRSATLEEMGHFKSSDDMEFNASDYGLGPKRRLTLGYDGILRLYTLEESSGFWDITWLPDMHACTVHGLCGRNGICVYAPKPSCMCPPGFNMTDPSDWSKGCSPNFIPTCNPAEDHFVELLHTDYYGYDLSTYGTNKSFEECRNACLTDCKCQGFGFRFSGQGQCYPKGILFNGYQMPNYPTVMYTRVPTKASISGNNMKLSAFNMKCSNVNPVSGDWIGQQTNRNLYLRYLIGFVAAVGIIEFICIGVGWWYINRINRMGDATDMGYLAIAMGFKRFTYKELKTATRNFKEVIGQGGFGTVYKGILDDDMVIAVKRLEGNWQGEEEFWAEVSIIGRINHSNLVKMWGFCAEGNHRLLVYEYLENGSLDRYLFADCSKHLQWTTRFHIALDAAKGLSYLHEECLEWVLHCDIKPQNILLDKHFQPKVADFGMSKFIEKKDPSSNFSKVRGTRGYLAPEWMMNQEITSKADVFSYGIVLLELITGKSASDYQENGFNSLAQWVKQKMKQAEGFREVADPRLNGDYDDKQLCKMIWVALFCVRDDREMRPAMSQVVELLVGDGIELYSAELVV